MLSSRWIVTCALAGLTGAGALLAAAVFPQASGTEALRQALTFHASFDGGVDAVRAAGDPALYSAPSFKQRGERTPGLPPGKEIVLARAAGRFGDALRFTTRKSPLVFFRGERNIAYHSNDWGGTVSVWLSVDPATDLAPGFCDPVQITSRAWNDGAFFVEFEKRAESIPFRLGVYADLAVWNPGNRRFEDIPQHERPLVTVDQPPFGPGRWTHVVFTFDRFNTARPDGVVRLYLDGQPRGTLSPRRQTFTWDPETSAIALGLGYVGLLDELSIFNRPLTDAEVRSLHELENGVTGLAR